MDFGIGPFSARLVEEFFRIIERLAPRQLPPGDCATVVDLRRSIAL
jgi:hypothetical protein